MIAKQINLDQLERETEKLLALLKDRQPGLSTWNEFLFKQIEKIRATTGSV